MRLCRERAPGQAPSGSVGVLEGEVEEGEKDGVLVRGGEAALVEELSRPGSSPTTLPKFPVSARVLDAVALTRKCVIRTLTSQSLTT